MMNSKDTSLDIAGGGGGGDKIGGVLDLWPITRQKRANWKEFRRRDTCSALLTIIMSPANLPKANYN